MLNEARYLFNPYEYLQFALEPQQYGAFKTIVTYTKLEAIERGFKNVYFGDILPRVIEKERIELVELLIENNADPNTDRFSQGSPLCVAMKTGNFEIVKYLIDNSSNLIFNGFDQDIPVEYLNAKLKTLTVEWTLLQKRNFHKMILTLNALQSGIQKDDPSYQKLADIF